MNLPVWKMKTIGIKEFSQNQILTTRPYVKKALVQFYPWPQSSFTVHVDTPHM